MKKSKVSVRKLFNGRSGRILAVAVVTVLSVGNGLTHIVSADQFDTQIQALQSQNTQAQANVNSLAAQASSYQDAVNKLQVQIDAVQAQISANQAQQAALQQEIIEKQAEIDREKVLLGDDIKAMYVEGDMSTVEMLATSKNLSAFVDKQEYRNAVQKNIQEALAKIAALQNDLKQKKAEVDQLIVDQKNQEAQLGADQQQQADMLAYTQAQKDQYTAQIASNSSKIASLRQQQIAANSRGSRNVISGGACATSMGDTYPARWCGAGQDTIIDPWGMYNRECVSYTAWKVSESGRDMPYWGGRGNAYQWIADAQQSNIPVDGSPRPGDVAIRDRDPNRGYWENGQWVGDVGHAMYVESVYTSNGETWIHVSQYNANLDGTFSTADKPAAGLYFIHF